jgi:hypothetical protein
VFGTDDIDFVTMDEHLTQADASELAHEYERMTFQGLEEYRVIQTGGI